MLNAQRQLWLGILVAVSLNLSLAYTTLAADTTPPELKSIYAQTHENQGIYGDAIKVIYNEAMLIEALPYPLAGGMEDVNDVPGSELKAPAEYPKHKGNATAKNAAKNYWVKIIPETGSKTAPYQGTWDALGGTAVYDENDKTHKTVLLLPPHQAAKFYSPGDKVEVTVAETVVDPTGNAMHKDKRSAANTAS